MKQVRVGPIWSLGGTVLGKKPSSVESSSFRLQLYNYFPGKFHNSVIQDDSKV